MSTATALASPCPAPTDADTAASLFGGAARALAEATARREAASLALAGAEGHLGRVQRRIEVLEGEQAAIVARRACGEHAADDAERLAIIAADLEGLAGIRAEAEAAVTAARARHEAEQAAEAAARHLLERAEDKAAEERLVAHARRLDGLLVETLAQLAEIGQRLGRNGRPAWGPSSELWHALRRVQAHLGRL